MHRSGIQSGSWDKGGACEPDARVTKDLTDRVDTAVFSLNLYLIPDEHCYPEGHTQNAHSLGDFWETRRQRSRRPLEINGR